MNELGRQSYLTAMGIDSYMPRLLLGNIPAPYLCDVSDINDIAETSSEAATVNMLAAGSVSNDPAANTKALNNEPSINKALGAQTVQDVLKSMETKTSMPPPKNQTSDVKPVEAVEANKIAGVKNTSLLLEPFVLTVWRPREDILIVDAHQKGEAYPTHTLLLNIFKYLWSQDTVLPEGDRVIVPLGKNKPGGVTHEYMRDSLQTWFLAEYEKRPCPTVWLMGMNATQFLLPENDSYENLLWQETTLELNESTVRPFSATILPSLTELLTEPALKEKLWHILQVSNVRNR